MTVFRVEIADDKAEQFTEDMNGYPGVTDYYEHEKGCCCKNCPWNGNHDWGDS